MQKGQEMSGAAILLFGKNPQLFFERARVRFIRYEGTEAKVGAAMNVIKDKIFEGRILDLVENTIEFVRTQIKEHTFLGSDAKFVTEPEYPEFVWKEIIVNAIAHRDYSIKGTDIQIKMFEDHITVESPGTLPGIVRLNNMRETHFSRNPKIASLLHEYEYVREFGEGIDRMYIEMRQAGLPEPEYRTEAFMVYATIKNKKFLEGRQEQVVHNTQENTQESTRDSTQESTQDSIQNRILEYCKEPKSKKDITAFLGYRDAKSFAKNHLKPLLQSGKLRMTIPDKPNSKNQKYVTK